MAARSTSDLQSMPAPSVKIAVKESAATKVPTKAGSKVGRDESFSDESSSGILEIWEDGGGPSKGARRPGDDSCKPAAILSKSTAPAREECTNQLQSSLNASSGESINSREEQKSAPQDGGPTPKPMPSAVPVAVSRQASQPQQVVMANPSGLSQQMTGTQFVPAPSVLAGKSSQMSPPHWPPRQGPQNTQASRASLPLSQGPISALGPKVTSNLPNRPTSRVVANDNQDTSNSPAAANRISHAPSEPRSPAAPLRYPPTFVSSTMSSRIPYDSRDSRKSVFTSRNCEDSANQARQPSEGDVKVGSSLGVPAKPCVEHGTMVEEVCKWSFAVENVEEKVRESLQKGGNAPVMFRKRHRPSIGEANKVVSVAPRTRGAGRKKKARVRENINLVFDAEFDKRYLRYDSTPSGSINVLVRTSDKIFGKDELFMKHLQQLPEQLPESDSASRIGRKYQSRIPHILTERELQNEEDPLRPE